MKDTNKINQVVNQKTLTALNHLVRDDTGYVNEHGVHFFTVGCGEINVHLMLNVIGKDNFAYLSLEEFSPEEFMRFYGIHHLEDLSDISKDLMLAEYHDGRAYIACVAGKTPQADMVFEMRDGKTVVTKRCQDGEVVLDEVIETGFGAEEYVLGMTVLERLLWD